MQNRPITMDRAPQYHGHNVIPFEPPEWIECPICEEETNSLKEHAVMQTLFFIGIYAKWESVEYTACPSCMRIFLVKRLIVNFFASNVLWPFLIVPPFLYRFVASFKIGHGDPILKEYYDAYKRAIRRAHWELEDAQSEQDNLS